jgi:hypothetical protein
VTEKYFYRDPLAAAWMAKHFGMQYTEKLKTFGKTDWQDPECYLAGLPRSGKTVWSRCNYYIHPASYPILEPKLKDKIGNNNESWLVISDEEYAKFEDDFKHGEFMALMSVQLISISDAKQLINSGKAVIEKRNGIAFMWPEKETVEEGVTE